MVRGVEPLGQVGESPNNKGKGKVKKEKKKIVEK